MILDPTPHGDAIFRPDPMTLLASLLRRAMSPIERLRARRSIRTWPLLAVLILPACTTFATVRPARVQPGLSVAGQASIATPPGELPSWMWSLDGAADCDHAVTGFELGVFHGAADSAHAWYAGGGLMAPLTPYFEAYRQLSDGPRASGVGFRVGLPVTGWGEYRVFYRRDLSPNLTTNTHFVVATGTSPNGANSATFVAVLQSFGLVDDSAGFIPAISVGITRTKRTRYDARESAVGLLATASVGVVLNRKPR